MRNSIVILLLVVVVCITIITTSKKIIEKRDDIASINFGSYVILYDFITKYEQGEISDNELHTLRFLMYSFALQSIGQRKYSDQSYDEYILPLYDYMLQHHSETNFLTYKMTLDIVSKRKLNRK